MWTGSQLSACFFSLPARRRHAPAEASPSHACARDPATEQACEDAGADTLDEIALAPGPFCHADVELYATRPGPAADQFLPWALESSQASGRCCWRCRPAAARAATPRPTMRRATRDTVPSPPATATRSGGLRQRASFQLSSSVDWTSDLWPAFSSSLTSLSPSASWRSRPRGCG